MKTAFSKLLKTEDLPQNCEENKDHLMCREPQKINKYAWFDMHTHQNQIQNISVWWMLDREGNCYSDYDIQLVQWSIMFQVNASDHIHIPICKWRKVTDIAWCRLMLCEFDGNCKWYDLYQCCFPSILIIPTLICRKLWALLQILFYHQQEQHHHSYIPSHSKTKASTGLNKSRVKLNMENNHSISKFIIKFYFVIRSSYRMNA